MTLATDAASRAPAGAPPLRLSDVVPMDPWYPVRATLISVYGLVYVYWTFFLYRPESKWLAGGLIIDRISVALSVALFLICAFVGRSRRRWAWLGVEAALYAAMWYAYEVTRGGGDGTHNWFGIRWKAPIQVEAPRNIDRFLFFGNDPNVVLQDAWYEPGVLHWYDYLFSVTYFTHFVFPVIAMAALWAISQIEWRRFMKRFATLLGVACILFVVMPTAPPWMASDPKYPYQLFDKLSRSTGSGFYDLGFRGFVAKYDVAKDWGNAVAAMPSLHAGFSLFVPAFFLPWLRPKWLKALVLTFPLIMVTGLVYFGEHWVIDALMGWAIVGGSFWFWHWFEQRQRNRRATTSLQALHVAGGR